MTHYLSEVFKRSVNALLADSLTIKRALTSFDSRAFSELELKVYKLRSNMLQLDATLSDL
jgi:hypothetical protein